MPGQILYGTFLDSGTIEKFKAVLSDKVQSSGQSDMNIFLVKSISKCLPAGNQYELFERKQVDSKHF